MKDEEEEVIEEDEFFRFIQAFIVIVLVGVVIVKSL